MQPTSAARRDCRRRQSTGQGHRRQGAAMRAIRAGAERTVSGQTTRPGSERERQGRSVEVLRPGDRVRGQVLQAEQPGRYRVRIGARTASAVIRFPVAAGETVAAVVTDLGPPLQLKAFGMPPDADPPTAATGVHRWQWVADVFRQALPVIAGLIDPAAAESKGGPCSGPIELDAGRLLASLQPLSIGTATDALAEGLAARISDGGMYFEKKLATQWIASADRGNGAGILPPDAGPDWPALFRQDLKPHLLWLAQRLGRMPAMPYSGWECRRHDALQTAIHLLLADIGGQHRRVARQRRDPESAPYYQHLLCIDDPEQKAFLRVYCSGKSRRQRRQGHRISLLLSMRRIGDVRVDMWLHQRALQIHFFLGHDRWKHVFEAQSRGLCRRLGADFAEVTCRVSVSPPQIEEFSRMIIERPDHGTVNVRI